MSGTALYQRTIAFDYGDTERTDLMRKVWGGTPWMLDVKAGSPDSDLCRQVMEWCRNHFGYEAWPIHGKPGRWYRGSATIYSWTWFGFDTEDAMREFAARWGDLCREDAP